MRKIIEHTHHHFDHVAELALQAAAGAEPFEHLIIGGLWEKLPEFESRLHRYLRDRIVARWDINVHRPTAEIMERARQEEQRFLDDQARQTWKAIRDQLPYHGALGPRDTLAALWQRRVQWLLEEPDISRPGFRCSACGRLNLTADPCVECGGRDGRGARPLRGSRPRRHRSVRPRPILERSGPQAGQFHGGLPEVLKRPGGGCERLDDPSSAMRTRTATCTPIRPAESGIPGSSSWRSGAAAVSFSSAGPLRQAARSAVSSDR